MATESVSRVRLTAGLLLAACATAGGCQSDPLLATFVAAQSSAGKPAPAATAGGGTPARATEPAAGAAAPRALAGQVVRTNYAPAVRVGAPGVVQAQCCAAAPAP